MSYVIATLTLRSRFSTYERGSLSNIVTSLNPLIMNHSYTIAWVGGSVQVLPMQMFWANKPSRGLMLNCLLFEVV